MQETKKKTHKFYPWVRRSPGGGHGNPLQYSFLKNPTGTGAWGPKALDMTEATEHACTNLLLGLKHTKEVNISK